jgi:hypothetical protein
MDEDNVIEGWDFSGIATADEEQPDTGSDVETDTDEESAGETTPDESSEEADAEESEQEETAAFGDDTEVDMGEGRQALKLSELKSGYMRQSDYTKKTQELATQRKEVDAQLESVKPMQDWLNFATSNPYLWTQINTAIQSFQQSGFADFDAVVQDAEYGKWINGFQAEIGSLTKELNDYKSKYGELEFSTTMDKTISELRNEYGDLLTPEYEAELRQQAKDEGIKSDMLKRIAKGDLAEKKLTQSQEKGKKSRRQIEAEVTQKQRENRLPPQPNKHGQKPGKQPEPLYGSFEEMARNMTGG